MAIWGSDKPHKSWVKTAKCYNTKKAFYCLPLPQVRCSPAITACICLELQHHHMGWLKGIFLSFWHTHRHTQPHTHPALPLGHLNVSCQNSGVSYRQLPSLTGWQLAWVSPLLQSFNTLTSCFGFKEAMGWKEKIAIWINPNMHLCSDTVQEQGPWKRMWTTRNAVGNTNRKWFFPDIVTQLLATNSLMMPWA